eukprot:TRINITY_DN6745_c0_g1_i1.p1 TRINITY_DN6745_c0_g1~~TRINITY_DN6745_c0_g1_i1.p1  ORF type:complete len:254 (-),score=37.87 TRINITY_DN6745_c0_g1_i1:156-896(-)
MDLDEDMRVVDGSSIPTNGIHLSRPKPEIARLAASHVQGTLDALPYVDEDYESVKQQVQDLIQREMRTFAAPDYLGDFQKLDFQLKDSVFLDTEYKRVVSKSTTRPPGIDSTRYAASAPPTNKKSDLNAWTAALHNAQSQLEHLNLRLANLELLQTYGTNGWKNHIAYLETLQKTLSKELTALRQDIEDVNALRKSEQTSAGAKIRSLESKWIELVHKNFDIEQACTALEEQNELIRQDQKTAQKA